MEINYNNNLLSYLDDNIYRINDTQYIDTKYLKDVVFHKIVVINDCYLFEKKGFNLELNSQQQINRTVIEAQNNKMYLEDIIDIRHIDRRERIMCGIQLVRNLAYKLMTKYEEKFVIFFSSDLEVEDLYIDFYKRRGDDPWLVDDLNVYKEDYVYRILI